MKFPIDKVSRNTYNVSRNKEVRKTENKSRADYFKERRKTTRNFSVEVDREKFDKLENKLNNQGKTKTKWLNEKIDEELKE